LKERSFYFADNSGACRLLAQIWEPEERPRAVLQIVHGINEYGGRYASFAAFLTAHGFAVAAHDLMGHGGSVAEGQPHGYFAQRQGWLNCLADLRNFSQELRRQYPGLPLFLLGHSIGSFMVRDTLIRFDDSFGGVILSGTGCNPRLRYDLGLLVCGAAKLLRGAKGKSRLVRDMCFGRFAKAYAAEHKIIAWLSRDPAVYSAYAEDPQCRFLPSIELIRQMLLGMRHMDDLRRYRRIRRDIPLLLVSGAADPVGDFGKGVSRVYRRLLAAGCADTELLLYPGARHEVLSDPDKEQAYHDILEWLEEKLPDRAACG